MKTFGRTARFGNSNAITEGFTIQTMSNREYGFFGDFNNKTISIGRLRKVLAIVQFQSGIATINTDMKFDGRTLSSTLLTFPRPSMQKSEFIHIQLDINGDHDIAEIAIGMKDHPYLHLFFTYTSLLFSSFDANETRRAIKATIYQQN